jgi:hypothetical protein
MAAPATVEVSLQTSNRKIFYFLCDQHAAELSDAWVQRPIAKDLGQECRTCWFLEEATRRLFAVR